MTQLICKEFSETADLSRDIKNVQRSRTTTGPSEGKECLVKFCSFGKSTESPVQTFSNFAKR